MNRLVKIAINDCIGGFEFPLEIAMQMIDDGVVNYEYLEKKGDSYDLDTMNNETVKFEKTTRDLSKDLFLVIRLYNKVNIYKQNYQIKEVTLQTTRKMDVKEELIITRSHPLIIEYLENANTEIRKCIKIVDIPDEYAFCWNITSGSDGREWVEECHRTWE